MPDAIQPFTFKLKNGKLALIREAKPTDAKELIDYLEIVGGESDFLTFGKGEFELSESDEAEFLAKCQAAESHIYLIAVVENSIVATLNFATGRRTRVKHSGEFGMSVSKAHWGQGIGAALLDVLIEWAKETKTVRKINLRVRTDNERAVRLYKSKGFKHEGTLTNEMFTHGQYHDLFAMGFNL